MVQIWVQSLSQLDVRKRGLFWWKRFENHIQMFQICFLQIDWSWYQISIGFYRNSSHLVWAVYVSSLFPSAVERAQEEALHCKLLHSEFVAVRSIEVFRAQWETWLNSAYNILLYRNLHSMSCNFLMVKIGPVRSFRRSSRKAWPFCDWSLTNGHWQRWSWLSPPSFGKAGGAFIEEKQLFIFFILTQFGVSAFPLNCSFLLTALLPKTTATILKTTKLGLLLKVKFEHIIVSSCCDHYYYHIIFIIVAAVVGGGGGLQWVQCVESITVWGVLEKSTDPAAEAAAAKAHVEVFQNHSKQVEQTAKWQAHFLVTMAKGDMSIMNINIMNWSLKVVSWIPWQWLKQKKGHVVSASPGARRPGCGRKIDQHHVAPSSTGEKDGKEWNIHVLTQKTSPKMAFLPRFFLLQALAMPLKEPGWHEITCTFLSSKAQTKGPVHKRHTEIFLGIAKSHQQYASNNCQTISIPNSAFLHFSRLPRCKLRLGLVQLGSAVEERWWATKLLNEVPQGVLILSITSLPASCFRGASDFWRYRVWILGLFMFF